MATNMAELVANMEELDKQSAVLEDDLRKLEEELRRETSEFEDKKERELGDLLESQNSLQSEFMKSKVGWLVGWLVGAIY